MNFRSTTCLLSGKDAVGNEKWNTFPQENALACLPVGLYLFQLRSPATLDGKALTLQNLKKLTDQIDELFESLKGLPAGGIDPALETVWNDLDKATVEAFEKFKKVTIDMDGPLRCYCPCHTIVQVKDAVGLLYGEFENSKAGAGTEETGAAAFDGLELDQETEVGVLNPVHSDGSTTSHDPESSDDDVLTAKRRKMENCTVKLRRLEKDIDRRQMAKYWIRYFNYAKRSPPIGSMRIEVATDAGTKIQLDLKNHR